MQLIGQGKEKKFAVSPTAQFLCVGLVRRCTLQDMYVPPGSMLDGVLQHGRAKPQPRAMAQRWQPQQEVWRSGESLASTCDVPEKSRRWQALPTVI